MSDGTSPPALHACMDCSKPLKTKEAVRCKSCSIKHTKRSRADWVPRYCKTCNGELSGSNRLKAIYCSKECKFADPELRSKIGGTRRRITKTCPACQCEFEVVPSMSNRYNFCSRECSGTRGEDVPCKRCGKIFRKPKAARQHHCSEDCRRPPALVTCEKCGVEFRTTPSDAQARRYCSASCYRASDAETTIERLLREVLDREMIGYQQQQRIGRWSVDFLLGKKLVIEADGDYWHAMRPDVDQRKAADLTDLGYQVWRIPESEITASGFSDRLAGRLVAYQEAEGPLPPADLLQALRPVRNLSVGARRVHGPLGRPRGEAMHNAKLTEEQVVEIRSSTLPGTELAKRYGIGRTTVGHIQTGRVWVHAGGPIRTPKPIRERLPDEAVLEIRSSTERGVDIAARLGIDKQTVSNIRCGRAYSNVRPAGVTKAA